MSKQLFPVGEAFGWSPDDPITEVSGKIKSLYDPQEHDGANGPFTIQNGVLTTQHGDIKLVLFSNTLPKTARGRNVTIKLGKDKKNKLGGVTYEISEYFSKKKNEDVQEEIIKVNGLAVISYEGAKPAESKPAESKPAEDKPNPRNKLEQESTIVYDSDPVADMELLINLHWRIDQAVRIKYRDVNEETRRCYVNSIFIQADKCGIVNRFIASASVKQAPAKPQEQAEEAKETDAGFEREPYIWESSVIPSGTLAGKRLGDVEPEDIIRMHKFCVERGSKTLFSQHLAQAVKDLHLDLEDDDFPL
jgi:hypothetical protein